MDTTSIKEPVTTQAKPSRLPAGSTLEITPGVHVAHPHAEVNLPGAGDPRTGDTDAVSEIIEGGSLKEVPLLDSLKPKALTVNPAKNAVAEVSATSTETAKSADTKLAIEDGK